LTPSEENWLKEHPVIRLGVDPNAPPTEFVDRDGAYSGIASGIAQLVSERLGIEFVVEKGLTWPQVLEKARSHDVDLLPCVARTKEREEYLLFTKPYLNVPVAIVTKTDAPYIESMEDLKGKTVAVVTGYQLHERIKTDYPEMVLVVSNSTAEALQAVSNGKAFAFPGNLAQTFYLMPKLGISNLKVAAPTRYSYAPCFGVRGDWPEFQSILDKALATITPEERTTISQKWIALDKFFGLDRAVVLRWLGAAAVLLVLLCLWNIQVRRQKRIVQESEQRLQTIMDSIPNAVFVTDGHGRKVMVNKEWERITRRDRSQAVGRTYEEIYPKRLAQKLAAADREVMETLRPISSEESIRTSEGNRTFVQSLRPLVDLSGRLYAVCGSATDITERKLAEEKLQQAYAESERSLAEAAHYVQALLPEPMNARGITAEWRFRPSAALGGDCFGYHWLDSDHFALYLLDVSGHGVSASLLAVTVLNLLRSQTIKDADFYSPGSVLSSLNRAFQMDDHGGMYFTIWYGVYDRSSRTLIFSSGGHPAALLIGPETDDRTAISHLRTPNPFIGGLSEIEYDQASAPVPPACRLYVFSDWVFEVEDGGGSMWGYDNLEDFVVLASGSGEPLLDRLVNRVTLLTQGRPLDDDFSILEVKFS
jgi:PAS domain S-box-containing protein